MKQLQSEGLTPLDRDSQHLATLAHWAAMSGNVEILNFLQEEAQMSIEMRDRYGQTPLHVACAAGTQPATALHLLEKGADAHLRDYLGGWTPLHAAARGGDAVTAEALCKAGVDVDAVADDGNTPLHRACAWCRPAVVEVLLQAGANRTMMNKAGRTALQDVGAGRSVGTEEKNAIVRSFHQNYVVNP